MVRRTPLCRVSCVVYLVRAAEVVGGGGKGVGQGRVGDEAVVARLGPVHLAHVAAPPLVRGVGLH